MSLTRLPAQGQSPAAKPLPKAPLAAPKALAPKASADALALQSDATSAYQPAPVAAKPEAKPGVFSRAKSWVLAQVVGGVSWAMRHSPGLNQAIGHVSGPFVKQRFNAPPKPGEPTGPSPLDEAAIKAAEAQMRAAFDPSKGKLVVGLAGTETETVHAFVVSSVKPDGTVMITQALAQYNGKPEEYKGIGGWISKKLDQHLGNKPEQMMGVVEEPWASYAARSKRNTAVVMSFDADPAKAQEALATLKSFVGRPYDKTMLAAEPATKASEAGMYCTEIAAWFVNKLLPGAVQTSKASGLDAFQVADIMRASTLHGGPLRVRHNAHDRLDVRAADPHPKG